MHASRWMWGGPVALAMAALGMAACTVATARPVATASPGTGTPLSIESQGTAPPGLTLAPTTGPPRSTVPRSTVPHTTVPHTTVPRTTVPRTTVPRTTVPSTGSGVLALDALARIRVENEHGGGYVRSLFHYPIDISGNCNTRAEVLMRDSLVPVTHSAGHCTVQTGEWRSAYDGAVVTDAHQLEIDHVVPLKEAWDSGAWAWSDAARRAYANDLDDRRTLRAVTSTTNQDKGDKDPSNWLPPLASDVCPYVADWVAIKVRWHLTMDQSEFGRIRRLLMGPCDGWRIATIAAPPVAVP